MHGRLLGSVLSAALTIALCWSLCAHAQSGKIRQLRQTETRGLSGREVKTRTEVEPERRNETKEAEGFSRTGDSEFEMRRLNEGRRARVVHSLDPEHITFAIIMGMIVLILVSRRV